MNANESSDLELLLKRYIPDLNNEDIAYYCSKYKSLDNEQEFLNQVIHEQENKNSIINYDFIEVLGIDEDFVKLQHPKDHLIKIISEYFRNMNIKNFLSHHTTHNTNSESICSVRVPSDHFEPEDIAFNPEGIYYKDHFIPLDSAIIKLTSFRITFIEIYAKNNQKSGESTFYIGLRVNNPVSFNNYRRISLDEGLHYGPPYSTENLFKRENKAPFTRFIPDDLLSTQFIATDFFLDRANGSFQIEEISNYKQKDNFYVNRYIHCEFDLTTKSIRHIDGSIISYDDKGYQLRKETTLNKYPRFQSSKKKVFRIDGSINIGDFENLVISFFEHNDMVSEYITNKRPLTDGEDFIYHYKQQERIIQEKINKGRPIEIFDISYQFKKTQ